MIVVAAKVEAMASLCRTNLLRLAVNGTQNSPFLAVSIIGLLLTTRSRRKCTLARIKGLLNLLLDDPSCELKYINFVRRKVRATEVVLYVHLQYCVLYCTVIARSSSTLRTELYCM